MARRKTAAKTKNSTTKKKNGSTKKNLSKDEEKIKDNLKNKSITTITSPVSTSTTNKQKNIVEHKMNELNTKSTKLLKSTTTEKLQLHLLNNIDKMPNYNKDQQIINSTISLSINPSTTSIKSELLLNSTTDNLIHRNNQYDNSIILESNNKNLINLNNNIDKCNNNNNNNSNKQILLTNNNNNNNNCQSSNIDKYLHKKFKRPASVTVIDNNNDYTLNSSIINSPTILTTNLYNEQQQNQQHKLNINNNNHRLSIDSIGGSDGSCSSNNNNNNNIGDNIKNNYKLLEINESFSSDNHLINDINNKNNINYIDENCHNIINKNKINSDNIEYQQLQQNNIIYNSSDINKKNILNKNDNLNQHQQLKNNNNNNLNEKSIVNKKLKNNKNLLKYSGPSSENLSSIIDIQQQQQQQLNDNIDNINYTGKGSIKRSTIKNLSTIVGGLPSPHQQINKQTNDIYKLVNNNKIKNLNNNTLTIVPTTISNSMLHSTNFNIINNQKQDIIEQQQNIISTVTVAPAITTIPAPSAVTTILAGRHVCPYCNLNCTKPSVLQKHIRAHTNERPYPCDKCGIAFKTNSNYYKHCRSRSHLQRMKGVVDPQTNDDDGSLGSDQDPDLSNSSSDVISGTTSPLDERISSPAVQQIQHHQNYHNHQQNQLSSSSSISSNSSSSSSSSVQKNSNDKPYKPKFHNAALYKDENIITTITTTASLYHPRNNQPQLPYKQQQQSSLSPYSNKQNQMTILPATSNLHNINNHISETSSNYYSVPSQFIQEQQQQILHNHSTYIHPSGINNNEQQQQHQNQHQRSSKNSVNCESAMVVGSIVPHHHHQQQQQQPQHQYAQQISLTNLQQAVAPAYNSETTGITNTPLVVRDSTGSNNNFGGSNSGGSLATATTGGGHQLNVEYLQEHISKLISQNQAIVENKEVLLQKKYPKQLNKQKSLSSLVIPTSSTVSETGLNSGSPLNSKLQLALANKQQHHQQQIQQKQQQHQQQQQQLQILLQHREDIHIRNSQNMNGFQTTPSATQTRVHSSSINKNIPSNITAHQISEPLSQQPLNLSKISATTESTIERINKSPSPPLPYVVKQSRKRSADDILSSNSSTPTKPLATHPQNPERSIIKHLLLNARGLGVPNGEGDDAVYTCPLCKLDFQTAEELKLHTSQYCQGGPSSAPISPVASPSYKYFRSNSINVNLPEFNNPTSLATLAKSSLLHGKNPLPLAKLAFYRLKTKQSNLILNQLNVSTGNTANNPTNLSKIDNNDVMQKIIDAPLPSPGPLLGKTPLVESYNPLSNSEHKSEDVIITKVHEERNFPSISNKEYYSTKKIKYDSQHISVTGNNYPSGHNQTFFGTNTTNTIFESQPTQKLQYSICGSDMQILDKKDNNLNKRFMSSGGCIEPITESSTSPKFFRTPLLSGGSFTEIIPPTQSTEHQQNKKRESSQLLIQNVTPKMMIPITPLTPSLSTPNILSGGLTLTGQHFQFPPINSITGFNPLTLPPISMSHSPVLPNGEKLIPYVPGIPGPNTISLQLPPPPQRLVDFTTTGNRNSSPNRKKTTSPLVQESATSDEQQKNYHYRNSIQLNQHKYQNQQNPIIRIDNMESNNSLPPQNDLTGNNLRGVDELLQPPPQRGSKNTSSIWTPNNIFEPQQQPIQKKPFNFTRIADNISPKKPDKINVIKSIAIPVKENRHFTFDNLSTIKTEVKSEDLQPLHVDCLVQTTTTVMSLTVPLSSISKGSILEPSLQSPQNIDDKLSATSSSTSAKKTKFLRPTSLPLKPGTFTPKRHHGITPTANTMPLISPETPRPSKTCGQMFLNGHAYTYLGLKCSTKMFYCTVNCPQPSYVQNLHKLSMYSVWQVQAEKNLHPLGLKPKTVMGLYDSRQRNCSGLSMANIKLPYTSVHSQHTVMTPFENNTGQFYHHQIKSIPLPQISVTTTVTAASGSAQQQEQNNVVTNSSCVVTKTTDNQKGPILVGGYESNEDYTYIRGRGRGKYVCSECGIRCKKPSMLVKHIRTHSDIRPYTCLHCNFSFKTKGNLTKHMQSKAHYKKCLELGVDPGEGLNGEFVDRECDNDQQSTTSGNERTSSIPGESDSEYGSDGEDRETESSDTDESKSRLPEHEAAHCLLSLSMTPPSSSISPHYRSQLNTIQHDSDKNQLINTTNRLDDLKNQQNNSARRVISFTSPKPFDYQKQEKYYSNPLIIQKNRQIEKFDENIMKPIDLTKPRSQQIPIVQQLLESNPILTTRQSTTLLPAGNINIENPKITDVIGNLSNESVFYKSLLSITDKIRVGGNDSIEFTGHHHNPQKQNDDILFQAYLTEQALQYTKIKQSQMSNKSFHSDELVKTSLITTATNSLVNVGVGNLYYNKNMKIENNKSTISETLTTQSLKSTTTSIPLVANSTLIGDNLEKLDNEIVRMQSPINSIKEISLDMPRITDSPNINESLNELKLNKLNNESTAIKLSNENFQLIRTSSISKQKDNAKSVASEYLKITQKTNSNPSTSGKAEEIPDDDDSSDQENSSTINTTTNISADSNNTKPSADFTNILARTVIVGEDGFKNSTTSTDSQKIFNRVQISEDNGRPICTICSKTFQKQHQLVLHMNIHYMERKFKCEPCAVSFRTQGHLQKHERSEQHKNKVMMTSTFGVPTTSNPRPYECADCKIAFRIHGHLAKHLRSKTHVQKLECSQKLPFGTYAEIERAGISLTEIDTTDCDNSLASLKILAQKLFDKDPSKLSSYTKPSGMEINSIMDNNCESGSEDNPDSLEENQVLNSISNINDDIADNRIGGIKRKFDSFSSCSNDSTTLSGAVTGDNRLNNSTTNILSQDGVISGNNSSTGSDEKRLRTTTK